MVILHIDSYLKREAREYSSYS